jgi:hypothetical protein
MVMLDSFDLHDDRRTDYNAALKTMGVLCLRAYVCLWIEICVHLPALVKLPIHLRSALQVLVRMHRTEVELEIGSRSPRIEDAEA